MKALTVRQPWASAIVYWGKDVENRTINWKHRGPLAIHAGTAWDPRGQTVVAQLARKAVIASQQSAIIGVVDLIDVHSAVCRCCDSPWGEHGFAASGYGITHLVLANPRALAEPIPCRGALGLWTVPADALAQMERAS